MKTLAMPEKTVHEGKNLKRIREILQISQENLAYDMGITQQAISLMEGKEKLDPKVLEDVAKALHVSPEAIKNFNDEMAVNFISNTFTNNQNAGYTINHNPTFNPIDKVVELYERMIKERDEIIERLSKK